MSVVTQTELENAQLDTVALKDIVNGSATINGTGNVTTRLGTVIKSLAKVMSDLALTTINSSAVAAMLNRFNNWTNTRWFLGVNGGGIVYMQNEANLPRQVFNDALTKFGYEGSYLRISAPGLPNSGFDIPCAKLLTDPAYIASGTVTIEVEIRADSAKVFNLFLYRVNAGVSTFIGNQSSLTANTTVQIVRFANIAVTSVNLQTLTLRFFMASGNWDVPFDIGRINVYGGANLSLIEFQTDVIRYNDLKTIDPVKFPSTGIEAWGDSLLNLHQINNYLGPMIENRPVAYFNYGGEATPQIRKRFLTAAPSGKTTVFWMGTNNAGNTDMILEDLRLCIAYLGHKRFIVLCNVLSATPTAENLRLETTLEHLYQNKFINIRKRLIDGYTYAKTLLSANFVQPALNANVTISVNSTAPFIVGSFIRIGQKNSADRYSVESIGSGTSMTIKLLTSVAVAPGATVTNTVWSGPNATYIETSWLPVMDDLDYADFNADRTPNGFRADSIHLNVTGSIFVANHIADKLYELNY
jgi:hypothetical protein